MSKLRQLHLPARRGVAGAGYQIRNAMSTRRSGRRSTVTKSRTRPWRLTAYGGTMLVTAVAIASTQAAVTGAQASVAGGRPVTNPFSLIHKHPYLRDAFPSVPQLRK